MSTDTIEREGVEEETAPEPTPEPDNDDGGDVFARWRLDPRYLDPPTAAKSITITVAYEDGGERRVTVRPPDDDVTLAVDATWGHHVSVDPSALDTFGPLMEVMPWLMTKFVIVGRLDTFVVDEPDGTRREIDEAGLLRINDPNRPGTSAPTQTPTGDVDTNDPQTPGTSAPTLTQPTPPDDDEDEDEKSGGSSGPAYPSVAPVGTC